MPCLPLLHLFLGHVVHQLLHDSRETEKPLAAPGEEGDSRGLDTAAETPFGAPGLEEDYSQTNLQPLTTDKKKEKELEEEEEKKKEGQDEGHNDARDAVSRRGQAHMRSSLARTTAAGASKNTDKSCVLSCDMSGVSPAGTSPPESAGVAVNPTAKPATKATASKAAAVKIPWLTCGLLLFIAGAHITAMVFLCFFHQVM